MNYRDTNIIIGRPIQGGYRQFENTKSKRDKVFGLKDSLIKKTSDLKRRTVSRIFWGRSNYHKNIFHLIMIFITLIVTITGVVNRFSTVDTESNFSLGNNVVGQNDLLLQGGSIETVLLQSPQLANIKTQSYTVQEGDTLASIAAKFELNNPDTIRWANQSVLNPFTDNLEVGWELTIPSIDGVLYQVKANQTLDDILAIATVDNSTANKSDIIEFNNLKPPYDLSGLSTIFVPDGSLRNTTVEGDLDIPRGVFIDPLSNPACSGYTWSRGFLSYHDGVDLARWPGCPIQAVANGVVTYAGWSSAGQGYNVEINHGGGIVTKYFHGDGTFWVRTGDTVKQGQDIMMMGTTGFSTGVHLHFSLWKNGVAIDPSPYVPYNRPY